MSDELKEILNRVTIDTLEKLAFIFAYSEDEVILDDSENITIAGVVFEGPFSGQLMMIISSSAILEIASNMLGMEEDEEVALADQHDTLKETLNIICGNLLPEIGGKQSVFSIGTPEILDDEKRKEIHENYKNAVTVGVELDDGVCIMSLFLENEI